MILKYITILLLILFGTGSLLQAQFAGGNGTIDNPYLIENVEQLQKMSGYLDRHFSQIADIDANETKKWNKGKGFKPVGDEHLSFSGTFNGGNFRISNLYISREEQDFVGLFGNVTDGKIENTIIENIYVTGNYYVGGVVGALSDGEIINSSVSGVVNGFGTVGGFLGYMDSGKIERTGSASHVNSMPSARTAHFGGLVGFVNRGNITEASATGNVDGRRSTGGLIGRNSYGVIVDCNASGKVSGQKVGGLIGYNVNGKIINSVATGEVSGSTSVGSIVGFNVNGEVNDHTGYGNIYPIE